MINRSRGPLSRALLAGTSAIAILTAAPALAQDATRAFDIPAQPLSSALMSYSRQSDTPVIASMDLLKGKSAPAVRGDLPQQLALQMLLEGSGLRAVQGASGGLVVERIASDPQSGSAAGGGAEVEALIVTAQKREEDIQDVPIAISAFSQEALERSQVAGGPDLMTQVPNMTFTKTNFSSYSIQLRGIGTQAISATTDPAVAVAFNNTPFIRNRFFEQEFYDLQRVEVLRGPQGTLYGRNATAGVVNVISQKPKFAYEAKLSGDVSNYSSTRLEGMVNLPLVEDKVALRLAGAWTRREGYSTNQITGNQIDGRDLWSTRLSLRVAPTEALEANLIWEHFQENDDRIRSGKQLCHRDARTVLGEDSDVGPLTYTYGGYGGPPGGLVNQGCLPSSLYSPEAFEAPNGFSLPYYHPLGALSFPIVPELDPYVSTTQSPDLRVIESTVDPHYRAETDIVELQVSYDLGNGLTLASETGYDSDDLFSTQDYNRFNTAPGAFNQAKWDALGASSDSISRAMHRQDLLKDGVFCDPQIGCADRLVAVDLSTSQSTQFSQEFRISSDFDGPFNFSLGANFLRHDTIDKYYVFINTLSFFAAMSPGVMQGTSNPTALPPWQPGVSDNHECMPRGLAPPQASSILSVYTCQYIDPNPIGALNDLGHNYFLSKNPYKLISYAAFGEAYYNLTDALKVTAGLRWTVDKKEAPRNPSWLLGSDTAGYPAVEVIDQEWREPTGRLTVDWKPKLSFTDETLLYGSYAHGYKAGGANPPAAGVVTYGIGNQEVAQGLVNASATAPRTFDPEFVDAFEVGAKNTMLDGRLTLNLGAFYYDYQGYQISYIVNRSAVNLNFDAKIRGLELEADWLPVEPLRLGLKLGYEDTRVADGSKAIDVMDRTAGNPNWFVARPFPTFPSNCVLPLYVVDGSPFAPGQLVMPPNTNTQGTVGLCEVAYVLNLDPVTQLPYVANPTMRSQSGPGGSPTPADLNGYPGFNPLDESLGHNHGEGFYKDLSGNELPNAPHYTATLTADYTLPLPSDWLMTLHTDLYYQSEAWTRIFNTEGYDKLKAYTNVNLAAIFTNEEAGWKVMAYVKNIFDRDSITGAFLNSDDSGLTTNVFLTEPRLYGLRVTKEWSGGSWWNGARSDHAGPYPLTVELGGSVQQQDAPFTPLAPDFTGAFSAQLDPVELQRRGLDHGDGRQVRVTYRPGSGPWNIAAGVRYGRVNGGTFEHKQELAGPERCGFLRNGPGGYLCDPASPGYEPTALQLAYNWSDTSVTNRESHMFADFAVGHDVGLGMGDSVKSAIALGLRYAQFESKTATSMDGIPNWDMPEGFVKYASKHDHYRATIDARREFDGLGPTVVWDGAARLLGRETGGHLDFDWNLTVGVLFGKQNTQITGTEEVGYFNAKYRTYAQERPPLIAAPLGIAPRNSSVTAPLLDLSLGASYEVERVKLSVGYRWERYFDVLDGGYAEHKDADRTIDGPYFKIAVGFGG